MIFVLPLPWGTEQSFSKYANTFSGFKPFRTDIFISFRVMGQTQPMQSMGCAGQ